MSFVTHERERLIETIREAGPHAPTLCDEWDVKDLLIHLIIREQMPYVLARQSLPGPLGSSAKLKLADLELESFNTLISQFERRPKASPFHLAALDSAFNTLEYTIHNEDVRRANGFTRRHLHSRDAAAVFRAVRVMSQVILSRSPVHVILDAPGHGRTHILATTRHSTTVEIVGEPLELALFISGREEAARVNLLGSPGAIENLRHSKRHLQSLNIREILDCWRPHIGLSADSLICCANNVLRG